MNTRKLRSGSLTQPMLILSVAGIVLATAPTLRAQNNPAASVPFTADQVEAGRASYQHNCQDCHGTTLDNGEFGGPALKGGFFRQKWEAAGAGGIFGYMQATMPLDRPGQLTAETYAALTAFILSNNGYAPGDKELPASLDALQNMPLKK
jgi:mono/diheme cytochrome c family protein